MIENIAIGLMSMVALWLLWKLPAHDCPFEVDENYDQHAKRVIEDLGRTRGEK